MQFGKNLKKLDVSFSVVSVSSLGECCLQASRAGKTALGKVARSSQSTIRLVVDPQRFVEAVVKDGQGNGKGLGSDM